jgi:hypothetical protein
MSSVRVSAYYARTASCYFFFYAVKEDRKPQLRVSSHLIVGSLSLLRSFFAFCLFLSLQNNKKKQHTYTKRQVTQRETNRKKA